MIRKLKILEKKKTLWTPIRCDRSYFFSVFRKQVVQRQTYFCYYRTILSFRVNGETVDPTYGSESEPVKTDRTGDNLGYSIALKYDLPRHWYLKAALEHNYRLPRYEEILGDRITTQVNTALNPEMANNYNLGVIYDHYYNNESRLQFEANVYTTKVKNMMYMLCASRIL